MLKLEQSAVPGSSSDRSDPPPYWLRACRVYDPSSSRCPTGPIKPCHSLTQWHNTH